MCAFAPEAGQRRARDLNDAALLGPLDYSLQTLAQNRVALGMRDDGRDSSVAQLSKGIRGLLRDAVIAELDQQVARAFDDVAVGMGVRVLQVVVGKMEVATEAQSGFVSN